MCVCLSVCVSVRTSVSRRRRVRSRPNFARARRIHSGRKSDRGRLPDFSHDDAVSRRSRANISGTAHRVSTEFRLPVPDVGRYAPSVSSIAGDVGKRKIFLLISGSRKNTHTVVCQSATVEELPCLMHLFPETPATSSKRRRSAGPSK